MKTIHTDVFDYDELTDKAKERARDWYRASSAGDNFFAECVIEDAETCARFIGIAFAKRPVPLMNGKTRQEPCVFLSGFSSQGDGACFEGTWAASDVKPGKLKEHAGQDTELHRIAAEFERIAAAFPQAGFTVKHSGHYSHKYCTDFTVTITDDNDDDNDDNEIFTPEAVMAEEDLIKSARDFMEWIYRQLEKGYEYENADEQVAETIRANEYTFTAEGKREG